MSDDLLPIAWLGTTVGAVDMSLVHLGIVEVQPTAALMGPTVSTVLTAGYLLAGGAALVGDLKGGLSGAD